jgi:uncharacterized protein (DUF58 family)
MALGCLPLIYVGFAPLIFFGLSLTLPGVESAEIDPVDEQLEVSKGDVVELTRTVTFRGGVGYIVLHEEVPGPFELVEGDNLQLYIKDFGTQRIRFSYKLRCTRRGVYDFKEVSYSVRQALDATTSRQGVLSVNQRIVVKPPQASIRRIRYRERGIALPQPSDSKMPMGIVSNDFKDLTTYRSGDPYKHINWKATARATQSITDLPIVNEFEREGNRVVWLFLDASHQMELGNSAANVFEHAVQVALGLADYYISRRCMVGFSLYNDDLRGLSRDSRMTPIEVVDDKMRGALFSEDRSSGEDDSTIVSQPSSKLFSLLPEAGRHQLLRIERLLQCMDASMVSLDFKQTLRLNNAGLKSTSPMIFLITSVRHNRIGLLHEELLELEGIHDRSSKGKKLSILINVQGYNLASKTDAQRVAAQIMKYVDEAQLRGALTWEATVINWDPSETSFTSALVREATQK